MTRSARWRRRGKWASRWLCPFAAALLLIAALATRRHGLVWNGPFDLRIDCTSGAFGFAWIENSGIRGVRLIRADVLQFQWLPSYRRGLNWWSVRVPLWMPAALFGAFAVAAWLVRGSTPGTCPRCGYDLSGVPTGVCPECGTQKPSNPDA